MQASSIPSKFPVPFGVNAGGGFIRPIPRASQIGIQNGAASLNDGFPPLCFTPPTSGGAFPFGADFNGILNQITAWDQWDQAGAPYQYDVNFALAIGGYPNGATLQSSVSLGYWVSTADNNQTNPDARNATATGSISGTTLTITAIGMGALSLGQIITGSGVATNTVITAFGTGSGGIGTYTVNNSQSVASTALTAAGSSGWVPLIVNGVGQCRLLFQSSTQISLMPQNGNRLQIDGQPRVIPGGGITLSNGSIGNNQQGYIYAAASGQNVGSLLFSSTAYVPSSIDGTPVMSSDQTKALVGLVVTDPNGLFALTDGRLGVLSYYNRRSLRSRLNFTSALLDSANSAHELNGGVGVRNFFTTWGDEVVQWSFFGVPELGGATGSMGGDLGIGLDGSTPAEGFAGFSISGVSDTGILWTASGSGATSLTEGAHTASVFIANNTNSNMGFNGAGVGSNGGIASTTIVVRG